MIIPAPPAPSRGDGSPVVGMSMSEASMSEASMSGASSLPEPAAELPDDASSAPDSEDGPAPDDDGDAPDPDELEPVEPAEPVVSANATAGMDAIAAPIPKANASAPTRPT